MTAIHVAVPAGAIPPVPAGAVETVHSRNTPNPAPAPQPMLPNEPANPLAGLQLPQPAPQPTPNPAQPQPAEAPALPAELLNLLAGLGNAQPAAAPVPAPAPAPVPQGTGLDGALRGVLAAGGVDLDRALKNALEYGDPNLIDTTYIREKGGASAAHFEQVARAIVANAVAEDAQATAKLHARAGGEANFNAAVQAFNASAPAQVKAVVQALIDSGKDESVMYGMDILMQFAQGSTMVKPGLVQSGAGATISSGLSKEDFQRELQALNPMDPQYADKRSELYARRSYGKSRGL